MRITHISSISFVPWGRRTYGLNGHKSLFRTAPEKSEVETPFKKLPDLGTRTKQKKKTQMNFAKRANIGVRPQTTALVFNWHASDRTQAFVLR